jgi:hypothetical protein
VPDKFWQQAPDAIVIPRLKSYGDSVMDAVEKLADFFAIKFASYARANARWQDQTAAARQGLRAFVERTAQYVAIYLTHSVDYGKWLELRFGGRFAIIMETLQVHYGSLMAALRQLVGA